MSLLRSSPELRSWPLTTCICIKIELRIHIDTSMGLKNNNNISPRAPRAGIAIKTHAWEGGGGTRSTGIRRALAQSVSDHQPLVSDFIEKYNFPDMDSKMTHSKKSDSLRKEQLLLLLAQIVVSCSEKRVRQGSCQGASGLGHSQLFA